MMTSTRDPKRCPTHPGEILREICLPQLGLPKTDIADHLGISRQTLYDLLGEKQPVTPQMAMRLGKLIGNGPLIWLNLQLAYDLWHARLSVDVSAIPTLAQIKPIKRG
jgi:antitoxin HigA-1